jgi:hypothetical protein
MTKDERVKRRLLRGWTAERLRWIQLALMTRELDAIEAELNRRELDAWRLERVRRETAQRAADKAFGRWCAAIERIDLKEDE